MRTIGHFLNGANVAGTSGRFGDIYNPATGEVQAKVAFASRAEMRRAVENAQKAFVEWSAVNPQRRARVMFNFKALVEKNMDALALMLSNEHGKVIADSKGDV
ncbi:MAG: aldehyde dehydrogenase family protein, partial [Rhizomicrobium sp.]